MPLSNPQLLVDRLTVKRRKLLRVLVVANVVVALLLGLLLYLVLSATKRSYLDLAQEVARGTVAVAEVNIASELSVADAVVRATADEIVRRRARAQADDTILNEVLSSRLGLMKGVEGFRLTDAAGRVRWGTGLPTGEPPDVSDREYFQQAKTHHTDSTLVAGPLKSKLSGHWVLAFARPMWEDGAFAGVLYVSIDVEHFREAFTHYGLEQKDAVTLRSSDLSLVARHSPGIGPQGEVGTKTVSTELLAALDKNPQSGSYVSRVAIDNEVRTTAYRRVTGWPFLVFAGVSHDRFFKGWVRQTWTVSLLAAMCWVLVAAATMLVFRAGTREANALQALADQTEQSKALLRTAGDGIHIVDHNGRLVEMSDSFAEMLGTSREDLLGRHVSTWDVNQDEAKIARWLAKIQDGDKQRVDVQHRRADGSILDIDLQMRITEIGGQLLVFGSARDVTAVKQLVREQTAMLESDLVGMAKVEEGRFTWRNAAFERIFGYERGELDGQPVRVLSRDGDPAGGFGADVRAALDSTGAYRQQMPLRRKSGDALWADVSAVQLSDTQILLMAIDITAAKAAQDHLAHVAFHDALTQLPNRLLLQDRLTQALAASRRNHRHVAVCFMDLDGFKAVNDELGHDAGDELLKEVARRLAGNIRPLDTAARIGGDEFVLVLSNLQGDEWRIVLDRVVQAIEAPIVLPNGAVASVGVTMGVVMSGEKDEDAALLERADRVMLKGKRTGKGRIFSA